MLRGIPKMWNGGINVLFEESDVFDWNAGLFPGRIQDCINPRLSVRESTAQADHIDKGLATGLPNSLFFLAPQPKDQIYLQNIPKRVG